jgi:uncharacterized protein DUF6328
MANEDRQEKLNRELIELLNELRVALPGVQVLFAFLLAVPFAQGWKQVDGTEKAAFFFTFLCTMVSTAFLIAPSAYHRIEWREQHKEDIVVTGNRLALIGMVFLGLAISGAVFFVTDFIYSAAAAIPFGIVTLVLYGGLWYVLPVVRRRA